MCGIRPVALALVVLAQVSVISCVCRRSLSSYNDIKYRCQDQTLIIRESDSTAHVECRGKTFDCSQLPANTTNHKQILQKLVIERCVLNSSVQCVLHSLRASAVEQLLLRGESTALAGEAVRGLEMINYLIFENGLQTVAPLQAIKQLQQLEEIRFDNTSHLTLPANAFDQPGIPPIKGLHIVNNNVRSLLADAFNGLGNLTTLNLFNDSIEEIDSDALRGVRSLETLDLGHNRLGSLPAGLLKHTDLLQTLRVRGNRGKLELQPGALEGPSQLIETVLQSSKLVLLAKCFHFFSCQTLEMNDSAISELPGDLFLNSTVTRLTLRNNSLTSLPTNVFENLRGLKELDLSRNWLLGVSGDTFAPLLDITAIYLQDNYIQVLNERLFSSLPHLRTLSFAHNNISEIHEEAFSECRATHLDMSQNRLDWQCYTETHTSSFNSPLTPLLHEDIQELDLSCNGIRGICQDWTFMFQLSTLNLSHNSINFLTEKNGNFVTNNLIVDLRYNNLTTINLLQTRSTFLVGNNPYICNCSLYKVLDKSYYDVTDAICSSPEPMKNLTLTSLADKDLSRSLSLGNLTCPIVAPESCSCILRPAWNRTECSCSDIQQNMLPDPAANGTAVGTMLLTVLKVQNLKGIPSFVKSLNISHLELETVPDIPDTITHLDLSHNKLKTVPLEILQRNITLQLIGNQLMCDCTSQADIQNIQDAQKNIMDYGNLSCASASKWDSVEKVIAATLCDESRGSGVSLSVLLVLLAAILAFACILLFKFSNQIKGIFVIQEKVEKHRKYDVFISYAHEDEKTVKKHLLIKLDKDFCVCEHTRDWIVGDSIIDQIYRSVQESATTLIVLSNAYLDPKGWAFTEFRAAIDHSEMDKQSRIVVILLEDVVTENAPEHIKRHLEENTYIKWEDTKFFWEKLYAALNKNKVIKAAEDLAEDIRVKEQGKQNEVLHLHDVNVIRDIERVERRDIETKRDIERCNQLNSELDRVLDNCDKGDKDVIELVA